MLKLKNSQVRFGKSYLTIFAVFAKFTFSIARSEFSPTRVNRVNFHRTFTCKGEQSEFSLKSTRRSARRDYASIYESLMAKQPLWSNNRFVKEEIHHADIEDAVVVIPPFSDVVAHNDFRE